jgi:hypothetical protein
MKFWMLACLVTVVVGCGHKGGSGSGNGDVDANGTGIDASFDAPYSSGGMCNPNGPQCSNCKDDDGDGRIDGFDPQCTGASDNDEATFSTGIPGDNKDAVNQDCFFDGNSGAGNDGCNIHVCCLLGAKTKAECTIGANQYNPADCPPPIGTKPLSQQCIDVCGKLTPPGCDCFGCCTVCDPASNACSDIIINPTTSPNCGPSTVNDPDCKTCTKVPSCGNSTCGGMSCILCPGQDPSDLPASCMGSTMCPSGEATCTSDSMCGDGTYCAAGCCIGVIL